MQWLSSKHHTLASPANLPHSIAYGTCLHFKVIFASPKGSLGDEPTAALNSTNSLDPILISQEVLVHVLNLILKYSHV